MIKTFAACAVLLASCAAAAAAPATPEEAQRLTTLFERYLGHPAGQASAVSVAPHGEAYTATLDVTRLFAFVAAAGYSVTSSPLAVELTPQDDGRWRVAFDGLPIVGFTRADQSFSMSIKGYKFDGLFDPKIQAFASATTATAGSVTRGDGPKGRTEVHLSETGTGAYGATDAGAATIDAKSSQSVKDFTYSLDSTSPGTDADAPPQKLAFTAHGAELASMLNLGGARVAALNDLWAFLVAHPSKEALVAAQSDLKAKLRAMLPLATSAVGDVRLTDLAVTTDKGAFGAGAFSEHYEFGGAAARDGVAATLKLAGLTLPPGLVPAWAAPLVPTSVEIAQNYGPLNLTPALSLAIDDVDLAADAPLTAEQQASIMQALAPGDTALTIAPSSISTASMTLRFEGDVHMTRPMPSGTATVTVTGLDKTIEQVRAGAPDDPDAAQAIAFLSAVKILAKADGVDSYSWHVVAAPGAEITVNGSPLSTPAPRPTPKPAPKTPRKKADHGGDHGHVTAPAK